MRQEALNQQPLTVEEYLAFEEESTIRHEYVGGYLYPKMGTTSRHNLIVGNLYRRCFTAEPGTACRTFFLDLKVRAARDKFYYPDLIVSCTPHSGDAQMIENPCIIVEVTSRSTRRIDRGEKLDAYRALRPLRAYLIVEQRRKHVTLHRREADGEWQLTEFVGSGVLRLPCLNADLTLDTIYEGVEMPPLAVGEPEDELWDDLADVEEEVDVE